ncbi:Rieske 2Fe-2S domain-containing protein [Arthrobacter sp. D1-17]
MQKAGPRSELAPGEASGHVSPVAVFHTEGELFAIDGTCTHQDASLADGWSKTAGSMPASPHAFTWAPGASRRATGQTPGSYTKQQRSNRDIMIIESDGVPNLPLA